MTRCFQPDVADRFLHGRLTSDEFAQAVKHAAGCADCRQQLFAAARPAPDVNGSMDQIQERLTTWRAARRAPLMPAFPWPKGHEVDRYVIIRSVGGTEDGVIYEAFDPERDDRVVVKQLDLHVEDPATPALMRVANQLCQLSHPNILQMLSVGVHAGFVYFVYELVKGTPLSQAGATDARQVLGMYVEAGRGLAAAHDAGIAHGCFSAASCVVGRDGKVKVLDFGVGEARIHRVSATRTVRDQEWTTTTAQVSSEDSFVGFIPAPARQRGSTGQFESLVLAAGPNSLGPRLYAAPELVLGEPPSPAADQFAFCAQLFHRLYGRAPVDGETIALWLRELLKGEIARPAAAGVPANVQAALLRGLARDPAARFDRMATLLGRLGRHTPAAGPRKRTIAALAIGATVAITGVVVASGLRGGAGAHASAPCDQTLAGWNQLWGPSQQDELTRATGATAAEAWPALRTRLDAWVGSWRQATHGFCSLPAAAADCPSRAHAAATDLLQLVRDGAPGRITLAVSAADGLPTADQCASGAPSPASAPILAVKADVRRRLGMLDEADQLMARPADDPAQRSYQSLVRGYTAADRGDLINARRLFEDATFEAQAARQPELGATASLQRLALSCSASERALWSGYLDAQVHVAGKPLPTTELRSALAQSLACEGKLSEAVKLRRDVAQALHSDEGSVGAAAALELARAQLAQGDLASAETVAHSAAGIYAQLYGARHPLAQIARLTVAEAQLGAPASSVTAAETIERVLTDLADHKEPDAVRGRALVLQARLADARGASADAVRLVQRATAELEASLGGTHPELAGALLVAGDLLLASGHAQEAETSYRQVAAILETLGQTESARLAHARAGIQLARWGERVPADADATLQWGLSPSGDALDPAVSGWVAEQLGRRAAARGELVAALAHYRAAGAAWQQSGDRRGLASALSAGALLATRLRDPDARPMLEQALQSGATAGDKPRLQAALARLLWPAQRDRARALARAALAELAAGTAEAADLKQWLQRRDSP